MGKIQRIIVVIVCVYGIAMAGCSVGFILGAGCEVPPNAKPENVKAMIEAPRKHAAPS